MCKKELNYLIQQLLCENVLILLFIDFSLNMVILYMNLQLHVGFVNFCQQQLTIKIYYKLLKQ